MKGLVSFKLTMNHASCLTNNSHRKGRFVPICDPTYKLEGISSDKASDRPRRFLPLFDPRDIYIHDRHGFYCFKTYEKHVRLVHWRNAARETQTHLLLLLTLLLVLVLLQSSAAQSPTDTWNSLESPFKLPRRINTGPRCDRARTARLAIDKRAAVSR